MENSRLDRWLVSTMQKNIAPANVRVALESQEEPREAGFGASPRLRINDRRTLVSLLTNPQMAFGDAYESCAIYRDCRGCA